MKGAPTSRINYMRVPHCPPRGANLIRPDYAPTTPLLLEHPHLIDRQIHHLYYMNFYNMFLHIFYTVATSRIMAPPENLPTSLSTMHLARDLTSRFIRKSLHINKCTPVHHQYCISILFQRRSFDYQTVSLCPNCFSLTV